VIVGLLVVIGLGAFLIWPKADIELSELSDGEVKLIAGQICRGDYDGYLKKRKQIILDDVITGRRDTDSSLQKLFDYTIKQMETVAEKNGRYQDASPDDKKRIIENIRKRFEQYVETLNK
jgi:hypothetical protein